jgi:ribosomal protein L20
MDQRVNMAIRQQQMQLQHLTHLLGALVKIKRKMPVRFEISHQLPGHSIALRAIVRVWGGVKVPRNS